MKLTALITILLLSTPAFADCYTKLTLNHSQDSASFHVYADLGEEGTSEENALVLLKRALDKAGCSRDAVTVKSVTCNRIVPTLLSTEICYIETKVGYFFTALDYVDTANVTFNRWD